jgi:DNA-binding MarR family transcriptional regulator
MIFTSLYIRNILRNLLRKILLYIMKKLNLPPRFKRSFTPKLAWDFASSMEKQAAVVYEKMGLIIPVITSSTLCFISEQKKVTLLEVSRALGISHQLAAQRVKTLLQLDIILASQDPSDKRRTNYLLTAKGHKQNKLLDTYLIQVEQTFIELNEELDIDLMLLLEQVNNCFAKCSLYQRIFKEGD